MKYDFTYYPESSYAHVVALLDRHAPRGLVVDLGCGAGQIAAPLQQLGFGYIGIDTDLEALESLAERGIEHASVDLTDLDLLPTALGDIVGQRRVVAITMLDVVEHLPDPQAAMAAVRAAMERVGADLLGLSVPNVAHADLAAQLLMGRWEVMDAGLLDRTHLSLFTERRLNGVLGEFGFNAVERFDTILPVTEQHEPPDAPALDRNTPLGAALRAWRSSADELGDTYQFIGVYRRDTADAAPPAAGNGETRPFATVVVRTRGDRSTLEDALTSLASQTFDDFEIMLIVNTADERVVAGVDELVSGFAPDFRSRIERLVHEAPGRSGPLNLALDRAHGRYLTFLDDDDVVLAHWMETFTRGLEFPGHIVRSICYGQDFAHEPGTSATQFEPTAAPVSFPRTFDFVGHLVESSTPFCSIALPVDALRVHHIRFDDALEVCEDYDVLLRAAHLCGVLDTGEATSLYRRWQRQPGTASEITDETWDATHKAVLAKLDAAPLLLPKGSASRLRLLEHDFHRVDAKTERLMKRIGELEHELSAWQARVDAYERSRFWKLTKPLRVMTKELHGVKARLRNH